VGISRELADAVLARIDESELVELALQLANVESPPGFEADCAEAIYGWLAANELNPRRVGMLDERYSVFGQVRGRGRGRRLAFNAHMDTWIGRDDWLTWRDPERRDYHQGWEEDGVLIGNPVANDKGPMAAFLIAAKAIKESGAELAGDILLTMVAGEIGQEPVDEFQGGRYLSTEVGSRFVVNHTPRAHYCVCAEATGFRKGWVEAGKAHHRIVVYGLTSIYTPYLERPFTSATEPNALVRALPLIARIEEWALDYEQRHRYECAGGTVVPRVNIGAIRSGQPWMVEQSPEVCVIYLDIRTAPGQDPAEITYELRELLGELGLDGEVEQYVNRAGFEARGIEPLSEALDQAHELEFGTGCEIAGVPECSMWRDHNIFNEVGIPALTYGPRGMAGTGVFAVAREDLMHAARVYALTALAICA
jgi:acetylornithine deacetylase/succinyl-diaminopimelate desuccinylase-like protein